ncbi:MAG: GntR family transcriptional regulator [Gemmatimonadaceae bacterium]
MPITGPIRLRRQQTTPHLIADVLRAEIQEGAAAAGSALRQEDLAKRFGVSRLPVRDALLRLEAEGLVVVHPNRGAFVTSLTPPEVREIYDMRVLLEGDLIERAVPRMTPTDWRRIDGALASAAFNAGGADWAALDRAFHVALYEPAERPRQLEAITGLRGMVDRYSIAHAVLPTNTPEWLRDHEAIVAAARAGAAAAARRLVTDHLERAAALVLAQIEPQ